MNEIKSKLSAFTGDVTDDMDTLKTYTVSAANGEGKMPIGVIKPTDSEQVEKSVCFARDNRIPLIPVSSGTPHLKGGILPQVDGSVIVDLRGMNRIRSINRRFMIAVVEPGVTYGQLQEALKKEGMTLSMPLAPKASKSVLASVLDLEPRLNSVYQWNFVDPLRCIEVTWGDGTRMFTGEAGGGPLDLEKQQAQDKWQVNGNGPMMLDFYRLLTASQGTMGIVAWASLKCEPLPTIHETHVVPAESSSELEPFMYRVLRNRFSDELFMVNSAYLASLLGEDANEIKKLRAEFPSWAAIVGIAGRELLPELRVKQQTTDISNFAKDCGLTMLSEIAGVSGKRILEKTTEPCEGVYWKERVEGAYTEFFFTTTIDRTKKFIDEIKTLAEEVGYPVEKIGVYIQPLHQGTSCHCEFNFTYDPKNAEGSVIASNMRNKGIERTCAMGAYFSRPYGGADKFQLSKDKQSEAILREIKKIFDPVGIMNPGRICRVD